MNKDKVIPITRGKPQRLELITTSGPCSIVYQIQRQPEPACIVTRNIPPRKFRVSTDLMEFKPSTQKGNPHVNSYNIDNSNRVHVLPEGSEHEWAAFASAHQLEQLVLTWPMRRLIEIWNALPGVTRVRKFTDRKTAVVRIWKAVQTLKPTVAENLAAKKSKTSRNHSIKAEATDESRSTKTKTVLVLLRRENGATLKELMQATGWQAHSLRGFLSGKVSKGLGLPLESVKRDGERIYRLPAES